METIRIPNQATYTPVSLTDLMVAAPLASRLLLGATFPGRLVQAAALGAYVGSAMGDWVQRQGVRKIDFLDAFGSDVNHLTPMPRQVREAEAAELAEAMNDGYTDERIPRGELASVVNERLTAFIASVTGQRVETSSEVREFTLAGLVFPFALGTCDMLSGDVSILKEIGIFEPHILAHEFSHRKGYFKELEAQALAYLALIDADQPWLVQSARAERLHRDLWVLASRRADPYHRMVDDSSLREELRREFHRMRPAPGEGEGVVARLMRALYDERMKLTGQNGLSDYDEGFTNFLYTMETRPEPTGASR